MVNVFKRLRRRIFPHLCIAATGAAAVLFSQPCQANLIWEDHFSDEAILSDGSSVVTPDGTTVTFSTEVVTGTHVEIGLPLFVDDLQTYENDGFFTFEEGMLGQHDGYLELAFDNISNDPGDYIELALNFDQAVSNLRFSLTDIDSGSWDDGIEVLYNGSNNVRDSPAVAAVFGNTIALDNESSMHGWEGNGSNAGNGQAEGNIDFDFGSLDVTSLRIRYFSTNDADSNPGGQRAGLTDLQFTTSTPEPSSIACMLLFAVALFSRKLAQPSARLS